MSNPHIEQFQRALDGFDARVQAAPADSWQNQSPCAEWKARDVVAHVANNLRGVAAGLGGPAKIEVSPDEDITSAWNSTRDSLTSLFPTADFSQNLDGPFGPMPADQLLGRIITADTLVHTWDLARSVGGDESLASDLVEGAYSGLKPMDAMIRRPGVFSDKIEAAAGADMQTEFLSFLGRQV